MNLKKFISGVSALTIAASAFAAMTITASAAGYTRTLTDQYAVKGYVADTLYDFQINSPEVLPTEGDLRYRANANDGKGSYGLHNYGSGTRSGKVSIPVDEGDIVVLEAYSADDTTTIDAGTKNDTLSSGKYFVYNITKTADSFTITTARYGGVIAALTMNVDPDAPAETLAVEYKSGNTVVYTDDSIDLTGKHVGDTMTVPFRAYVQDASGNLYQTTKNSSNPWYGDSVTLAADTVVTKAVTPVAIEGTVEFFKDFDATDAQNAGVRASYQSAYDNKTYTSEETIPAGIYTFVIYAQNKGRGSSIAVGDTTVASISDVNTGTGAWTWKNIENVEIAEAGNVELVAGGSKTVDDYDIIIAIKTADLPTPVETTEAGFTYKSTIEKLAGQTVTLTIGISDNGVEGVGTADITDKLAGFAGDLMLAVVIDEIPEGITITSATIDVE